MNNIKKQLITLAILCSLLLCALAAANPAEDDPYKIVQHTTEQVLEIIKNAKGDYKKDPQRFNQQVTVLLEEVIDFDKFARSVMGSHASEQHYKTLTTDAEKAAFRQQIKQFSGSFKQGIVDTYARSLFDFNGQKIVTLPARKSDDLASGAVTVMQNVYSEANKPYVIQYSMRRSKNGEWKLNNLIVEGINLGLTYRNQFAVSAERYKGDIDKVIANWQVDPKAAAALKNAAPASTPTPAGAN